MAGLTYNELLRDAMLRHQVGLLLVSGSIRNEIWALLDATEKDVRAQIRRRLKGVAGQPLTPGRRERVEGLLKALRKTRLSAWEQADEVWNERLTALALKEPQTTAAFIGTIAGVELGAVLPPVTRLRQIVTAEPFMGATLSEWAEKAGADDIARIEQAIRIGLTQGETIPQISARIVGTAAAGGANGVTATARRNAEAITRTAVMAISSGAREELYAENSDLFEALVFTATLDSRTTPICRSLDGKRYKVGEAPVLPLHWGERSLLLPAVNGEVIGNRPMRNFTQKQLLREYANERGFKAPASRDGLPHGEKGAFDAWARKRQRELTGQVPASTTYQQWLGRQSASFQTDILGPTRTALFRRGNLTLDKFVAPDGRELTLSELSKLHARAFREAGLDPVDFAA